MNSKWKLLTAGWMIFIAVVCLRPADPDEPYSFFKEILQDLSHVPLFGILIYFLIRSCTVFNVKTQINSFFITFAYGVLIEVLQMSVPGRYASISDAIRDAIGALLVIFYLRHQARNSRVLQ